MALVVAVLTTCDGGRLDLTKEKPVRAVDWTLSLMEAPMSDLSAPIDILIADQRLDAITHGGAPHDTYASAWRALDDAVARIKHAMRLPDGLDPIHAAA